MRIQSIPFTVPTQALRNRMLLTYMHLESQTLPRCILSKGLNAFRIETIFQTVKKGTVIFRARFAFDFVCFLRLISTSMYIYFPPVMPSFSQASSASDDVLRRCPPPSAQITMASLYLRSHVSCRFA